MKSNDYANALIQFFVHVSPLRDYFLMNDFDDSADHFLYSFAELVRKMWNPRLFKAQVSPHEFLQAVSLASNKKFSLASQIDPMEFLPWFLNKLSENLSKRKCNIISKFQGKLKIITTKSTKAKQSDFALLNGNADDVKEAPFYFLTLDLPSNPLFLSDKGESLIPQIAIEELLAKYNGNKVTFQGEFSKKYSIVTLPDYLLIHVKRFVKNVWTTEKNSTIVNFPLKHLEIVSEDNARHSYDLIGSICHEGQIGAGNYKCHILSKSNNQWYEIQDLSVVPVLPPSVLVSESYIQLWEKNKQA